jgi:hypothetical protein
MSIDEDAMKMRDIGLDVHLDFCEVAICQEGTVRSAGRIQTKPEQIELFAESLATDDRVALEVTANSWEIARILEQHVAQVIVVSPGDTGMRQARAKTDRLDARTLAKLLAAGELDAAYARTVRDWQATHANRVGASATPGRASNKPSKGKAARQTTSP